MTTRRNHTLQEFSQHLKDWQPRYLRYPNSNISQQQKKDLRTINNLWLHYSESKFGLSVQEDIYVRLGAGGECDEERWEQFGCIIGWRKKERWLRDNELTFNLNLAPQGHLPTVWKNIGARNTTSFFFLLSFNL